MFSSPFYYWDFIYTVPMTKIYLNHYACTALVNIRRIVLKRRSSFLGDISVNFCIKFTSLQANDGLEVLIVKIFDHI